MNDVVTPPTSLGDAAARQLANATKTVPQLSTISPRWLIHCLQWVPVEAGIFRLNKVKDADGLTVDCSAQDERDLPETFADYEEKPREYMLSAVTTVVDIHTRISDLYSVPHNQIAQQLRLTIETIKERQERELVTNKEYGLLNNVAATQTIQTRKGAPTPDDPGEATPIGSLRGRSAYKPALIDSPNHHDGVRPVRSARLRLRPASRYDDGAALFVSNPH